MDKKLTVSLDRQIIDRAKKYAKLNDTSLSKMIEAYFKELTETKDEKELKITPLVESLCGVIELPEDFDYKRSRAKHLSEKYK